MKGTRKGGRGVVSSCSRFLNPRGPDYPGAWNRLVLPRFISTKVLGDNQARSFKVFPHSSSEAIPIFLNRLKSDFVLVRSE